MGCPEVDAHPGPPGLGRHESVAHGVAPSAEEQSSDTASCEWTIRDRDVSIVRLCPATVIHSSGPTGSSSERTQHATSGARWSCAASVSTPGAGLRCAALREIDRLMDAQLATAKGDKLDVLVILAEPARVSIGRSTHPTRWRRSNSPRGSQLHLNHVDERANCIVDSTRQFQARDDALGVEPLAEERER